MMEAADTAWMLVAIAMVLFMVPGLALFYGGMVRSKNVLNMLMMNMYCLGSVTIAWVLVGYTVANRGNSGLFGTFEAIGLKDVKSTADLIEVGFLMTFAVITPALISGAVADRMKFSAWVVFVPVWSILVYCPVTYWMYSGWMSQWGVLDFAGGTTIHINAGIAAFALVLLLGPRKGWPESPMPPHNLVFVMLGAGMLWFGWFGFNAGSAFGANEVAARAMLNTFIAGGAGMLGWLLIEQRRDGKPTSLGAASGVIAGLATVTPAAGFVGGLTPILFGFVGGVGCYLAVQLKSKFGYDDSLDVIGVHMFAGILGGLLLGLFADVDAFTSGAGADFQEGGFTGGGFGGGSLFWDQIVSMLVVLGFSFAMTWFIGKTIDATIGLRVDESAENDGLDTSEHAETAYNG
jgi:ammonium transporter, Amt family